MSVNNRELVRADSSKLSELIDEANAIFNRGTKELKYSLFILYSSLCVVHTTSDASLDSKFMTDTADLGVAKVHKLPSSYPNSRLIRTCEL